VALPQGMMFTEMWIDRIARSLGTTPEAVRTANMYAEKDKTHYGQELEACQVKACWQQVGMRSFCACHPNRLEVFKFRGIRSKCENSLPCIQNI